MEHFDLAVIGSGTGNSIIDPRFDDWQVALIDGQQWFGGTCLNVGCIPTKMFVQPAEVAEAARTSARLGVDVTGVSVRWASIRDRIFGRIDPIASGGEAYRRDSGNVRLYREFARFTGPKRLLVGADEIAADRIVLAAGSRPVVPEVPGLDDPAMAGRVHTSDTIMRLERLPSSLVIVGGGIIAAEFAHIFSAYGTAVTLLHRGTRLLRHADEQVGVRFTELFADRVDLRLGLQVAAVEAAGDGVRVLATDADGDRKAFEADAVLLATGRVPNSDTLDLPLAGVQTDERGLVVVDEFQRTTADGVFALGDLSSPWQLKHVANHEGRVVQHNLLHPDDLIASDHRFVPHAVFSGPQVAWAGLTEAECADRGLDYTVGVRDYAGVAYGWALEDVGHFAKVIAEKGTGRLLGAHIIGPEASILIQPLVTAMSFGLTAQQTAHGQYWIHPALTEVVENALLELDLDTD